jgi:DNA-binding response OmpR family regulator
VDASGRDGRPRHSRRQRKRSLWPLVTEGRNRGLLNGVANLVVTATTMTRQQVRHAGFDEYLHKPVDPKLLWQTVYGLARPATRRAPDAPGLPPKTDPPAIIVIGSWYRAGRLRITPALIADIERAARPTSGPTTR